MRTTSQRMTAIGAPVLVLLALVAGVWWMNPGQIIAQSVTVLLGVALIVVLLRRSTAAQRE